MLLGSVTAIVQFFLGYLVNPGGFGLSRYLFGFIDIVSVPVLIPLLIYIFIAVFRGNVDFANFALLWLIPVAALRALGWSSGNDPILLVVVPLLWTALALGISFFIHWMIKYLRWYTVILSIIFIPVLPVLAAGAYWAFFSHQTFMGLGLLLAAFIPFVFSFILDGLRTK